MCGSFALLVPLEKILQSFQINDTNLNESDFTPREKIRPTERVPVITADQSEDGDTLNRKLTNQKWGFMPEFTSRPLINARGETVDEKSTFYSAFLNRRCLIPASSFYEWKEVREGKSKQKYTIKVEDKKIISFAGLYSTYQEGKKEVNCFVIITRPAPSSLQPVHDRMPVILNKAQENVWLQTDSAPEELKNILLDSRNPELNIKPPPDKNEQLSLFKL